VGAQLQRWHNRRGKGGAWVSRAAWTAPFRNSWVVGGSAAGRQAIHSCKPPQGCWHLAAALPLDSTDQLLRGLLMLPRTSCQAGTRRQQLHGCPRLRSPWICREKLPPPPHDALPGTIKPKPGKSRGLLLDSPMLLGSMAC
jgi:hypothetical protein